MTQVATSYDPATGGVLIQWTAPHDGFQTITNYLIEIESLSGTFIQSAFCGDTILLSCIVPMSELQATYSLPFDSLVVVRATAENSYGYATLASPVNTVGAFIRRVPD
jgi:hypothetical protein